MRRTGTNSPYYRAMAADRKDWSDLDTTVADALYVAEATGGEVRIDEIL